jgi:rRNA processing/ribosome biogenesis
VHAGPVFLSRVKQPYFRENFYLKTLGAGSAQPCHYFQSVCLPISSLHTTHSAKKQEALPTLKAATRLLTHIFSVAVDTPEFQRQIASPNVPKFSLALVAAAEDHPSLELKVDHHDTLPYRLIAHISFSYSPSMHCRCWFHCTLLFLRLSTDGSPRYVFDNSTAQRDNQVTVRLFKPHPVCIQSFL